MRKSVEQLSILSSVYPTKLNYKEILWNIMKKRISRTQLN